MDPELPGRGGVMKGGHHRVLHAIHQLRADDHSAMEDLILQGGEMVHPLDRLPRQSGPLQGTWDGNEAWADRVLRHIFNLSGEGRWRHADAIATSAMQVFGDLDDADQIARLTAVNGQTALGVGDHPRAFAYTTLALVHRGSGNLSRRALASTANTIGATLRMLRAWQAAIDEFDASYAVLDLGSDAERIRAYLSLQQIVICLHESVAAGADAAAADHPDPAAVEAHSRRLEQIADIVSDTPVNADPWPTRTLAYISHYARAAVHLSHGEARQALELAVAMRPLAPTMIGTELLSLRMLGLRAAVATQDLPIVVRWAAEAERLATAIEPHWLPDILRLRGTAAELAGETAAALADFRTAAAHLSALRASTFVHLAALVGSRAELEQSEQHLRDRSAELAREAGMDPLTGVANRRALTDLAESAGDGRLTSSVVVAADIDHFKRINDTFGHVLGDDVLRRVARLLADVAGPEATVVRLGGDEFVAVLADGTLGSAAVLGAAACERVRSWPWEHLTPGLQVTVSVGVAEGGDLPRLLAAADQALYESKRGGRNCVTSAPSAPPR